MGEFFQAAWSDIIKGAKAENDYINHMLWAEGTKGMRKLKTRKSTKPRPPTESQEMQILAEYLDLKGYLWCHVPNEGRRSLQYGARLKREGVKRGVPDVLIFAPVRIAIELKRQKGGKVSNEQEGWLWRLEEADWSTHVAYGAQSAIQFIDDCINHPERVEMRKDLKRLQKEWYGPEKINQMIVRLNPEIGAVE